MIKMPYPVRNPKQREWVLDTMSWHLGGRVLDDSLAIVCDGEGRFMVITDEDQILFDTTSDRPVTRIKPHFNGTQIAESWFGGSLVAQGLIADEKAS